MSQQTKKIGDLLQDDESRFGQLVSKARAISRLNQTIERVLSQWTTGWYTVANYHQGILTIVTDNAASATQLRYAGPNIVASLRQLPEWCGLIKLQVKVDPHWAIADNRPSPKSNRAPINPEPVDPTNTIPVSLQPQLSRLIDRLLQSPKPENHSLATTLKRLGPGETH